MSESREAARQWISDAAARMQGQKKDGARPTPETLTVRELVGKFGFYKRTRNVVGIIRQALEDNKLHTIPDSFDIEYFDNTIKIALDEIDSTTADEKSEKLTVRIDSLPAAHNAPVWVNPNDQLSRATTLMRFHDFSQLPIMENERRVVGMISWRSIGEAYAHGCKPEKVWECKEDAYIVEITRTLSDAMNEIHEYGYVLVRGEKSIITGIVTASDIAVQFKQLAHPFLLVGEIERYLRSIIHGKFTVEDLNISSNSEKKISGPYDMTFGNYIHLFERNENWDKLELSFDRKEFIRLLDEVREIRNDVMHFSLEEPEHKTVAKLEGMVSLLRKQRALGG